MITTAQIKILVVDDNPGTRYSTSRILRSAGYTVVEAGTGREGLAAATQVDLVVLDINLPDIDGFEVCEGIRSNKATARTPVIHLSATFVAEHDKVKGLNHGADGYLTHPVEAPVLLATVNAFLRARRAEDAMWESEAKFRSIFDQIRQGVSLVSEDFVYLEINPAMCQVLGRTRDEIIGKHNSAFMPLGHEREVLEIAKQVQEHGVWHGNSALIRSDAGHVELEWSVSKFSVPGVWLALATDITQRRANEAERERLLASERAARTEAERANRLKDDFLATLSHELRTPLNAIVGWVEVLRRGTPGPEDVAEGLEAIERNVKSQSQLIADLLDVSRITSGKLRLDLQQVDASAIVGAALESVMSAAKAKNISLVRKLEAGPVISADPNRLQQIVWNLVTNAVKFTPHGGTVEVAVHFLPAAVEMTVSDTGQGIAPEFLPHLFERFSQADASSRRVHGGLGIGLAIVRNLVEMHGGTISAGSAGLGKGATFTMVLPMANVPPCDPSPVGTAALAEDVDVRPTGEVNLRGIRVLVVDDDPDSRRVLTRLLADFEATVEDADSVSSALETLPRFKPDVLVSDIGMPGRDGYDLMRNLRQREGSGRHVPAIALTAFAGAENVNRSLRAGFQSHLTKPVNPVSLVAEIAKAAGGRQGSGG